MVMCTRKSLTRFLTTFATAPLLLSLMAVLGIVLSLPADARAVTFADWAAANGYSSGAVMPQDVRADNATPAITSLAGIGDYNWTATPTTRLYLRDNQISSIESGDFTGLTNLSRLYLQDNQISSIESGDFNGLMNLTYLGLHNNQISSIE